MDAQALAQLTGSCSLSGHPADELVDKCTTVMREYRGTIAAAVEATLAKTSQADGNAAAKEGDAMTPAPAHGSGNYNHLGDRLDVFAFFRLVRECSWLYDSTFCWAYMT